MTISGKEYARRCGFSGRQRRLFVRLYESVMRNRATLTHGMPADFRIPDPALEHIAFIAALLAANLLPGTKKVKKGRS